MKIYLADLCYNTIKTYHVVPLSAGYLAATLRSVFGKEVQVEIFKYPDRLHEAIRTSPPDLLGLSNYSWNTRLNRFMCEAAKASNEDCVTVLGGPHIRTDPAGIEATLRTYRTADYYVLFEGERILTELVEKFLAGDRDSLPRGCATRLGGTFRYDPVPPGDLPRTVNVPSPYLSGVLDDFIRSPDMIPLFESNRGCPFGCTYCAWGVSAKTSLRLRDLAMVLEELDYVGRRCAGQVNWMFCDSNFGIVDRDLQIARKIKDIQEARGFPLHVTLEYSKCSTERTIEIARLLNDARCLIALQTTDPAVSKNCGRGNIRLEELKRQVLDRRNLGLPVSTDLLLGLPGDTTASHAQSIRDCFDLGFEHLQFANIRLLPGSRYETDASRRTFGVKTKFRPILGCYTELEGRRVFECEESVRATAAMSEEELESFKIIHWLLYLCWAGGAHRPILRYGQVLGINPYDLLHEVSRSDHPLLRELFEEMRSRSAAEWFDREEDFVRHYDDPANFERLKGFYKLNVHYLALAVQDVRIRPAILESIVDALRRRRERGTPGDLEAVIGINRKLWVEDPCSAEDDLEDWCPSSVVPCLIMNPGRPRSPEARIVLSRPAEQVAFCRAHLETEGRRDFSLQNIARFLDMGGIYRVLRTIRLAPERADPSWSEADHPWTMRVEENRSSMALTS